MARPVDDYFANKVCSIFSDITIAHRCLCTVQSTSSKHSQLLVC